MHKKRWYTFAAVFILCFSLILGGCSDGNYTSNPYYSTSSDESSASEIDWSSLFSSSSSKTESGSSSTSNSSSKIKFPFGFSDPYSDSYFTKLKDNGDCRSLNGKVVITVFFVSDNESSWNSKDIESFKKLQLTTNSKIEQESKKFNASLNITNNYIECKVKEKLIYDDYEDWVESAVKAAGFKNEDELSASLKQKFSAKEAPVIFAVNRGGRSYAHPLRVAKGFEYAIMYKDDNSYAHELMHLFGAEDLYFPQKIKDLAKKLFPNSIMLDTQNGIVVDDLTAYLLGWTNTLTDNAKKFLDETEWVTTSYMNEAHDTETFTGTTTREEEYGTYTGELVYGLKQGKGTFVFKNGDKYTGDFDSGLFHGKGTYTWADGTTYTGDYVNDKKCGKGKMVWKSGNTYTGDFAEDEMYGKGTYTWASGNVYTGDFVAGYMQGNGKMVWKNGATYVGDFVKDKMHGKGTYTWASGDYYSGDFKNDAAEGYGVYNWVKDKTVYKGYVKNWKLHGQGTCTWADGTKQSGLWENDEFIG